MTKHRRSGTVFHRLLTQPSCSKLRKRMEWKKIMDVHIPSASSCWRLRGAVTAWQGWGTSDERNLDDVFAACKPVHPNANTQTKKGTVRDTLRWLCYTAQFPEIQRHSDKQNSSESNTEPTFDLVTKTLTDISLANGAACSKQNCILWSPLGQVWGGRMRRIQIHPSSCAEGIPHKNTILLQMAY